MIISWHADEILNNTIETTKYLVDEGASYIQAKIKEKINEKALSDLDHSLPGNPPLRQSGNLYNSINKQEAIQEDLEISSQVYTTLEYGRNLERGIGIKKRPYMRDTLDENKNYILRLFE